MRAPLESFRDQMEARWLAVEREASALGEGGNLVSALGEEWSAITASGI